MVFVIVFRTAGVHKPLRKAAYCLLLKTLYILCQDLYRRGKNINISSFHTIVDITPVPFPATKIPAERSKSFFSSSLYVSEGGNPHYSGTQGGQFNAAKAKTKFKVQLSRRIQLVSLSRLQSLPNNYVNIQE